MLQRKHKQCLFCGSFVPVQLSGYEKDSLVKCAEDKFVFSRRIRGQGEPDAIYHSSCAINLFFYLVRSKYA